MPRVCARSATRQSAPWQRQAAWRVPLVRRAMQGCPIDAPAPPGPMRDDLLDDGEPPSPPDPAAPRTASAPRPRSRAVDAATGHVPEEGMRFDVAQSLRVLRTGDASRMRREMRKLRIRWWRATRTRVESRCIAAWCLDSVVEVVAGVIDACRERRVWASNASHIAPSVELVAASAQEVER
eukprot:8642570-Pyramimonas_sp.AAC.1